MFNANFPRLMAPAAQIQGKNLEMGKKRVLIFVENLISQTEADCSVIPGPKRREKKKKP